MPIFEWPHPKEDDSQYLRLLHKHFIRANFTLLQYLPLNQNKNISKTSWFGNDSEQTCGCRRTSFWAPITGSVLNWAWGNSVSGADDTSVGLSNSSGLFFLQITASRSLKKGSNDNPIWASFHDLQKCNFFFRSKNYAFYWQKTQPVRDLWSRLITLDVVV